MGPGHHDDAPHIRSADDYRVLDAARIEFQHEFALAADETGTDATAHPETPAAFEHREVTRRIRRASHRVGAL